MCKEPGVHNHSSFPEKKRGSTGDRSAQRSKQHGNVEEEYAKRRDRRCEGPEVGLSLVYLRKTRRPVCLEWNIYAALTCPSAYVWYCSGEASGSIKGMVWALYSKSQSLADIDLTLLDAIYIIQKMPGNKLNTGLDDVTTPCASAYRLDRYTIHLWQKSRSSRRSEKWHNVGKKNPMALETGEGSVDKKDVNLNLNSATK